MLVSTVTPMTRGRGRPSVSAVVAAASAAARIIFEPPEQCTFTIHAPVATADDTAPATVFGMSWNFRSRNTCSPSAVISRTIDGPTAVKSCLPILKPPTSPRSVVARVRALSAESTSRATRIGFMRVLSPETWCRARPRCPRAG